MGDLEREILLGYMLGALEEHEHQEIRDELEHDETLCIKLANVQKEVKPIQDYAQWSKHVFRPPQGLAKKTARNLWETIDSQALDSQGGEPAVVERTHPVVSSGPSYQKQKRPQIAAALDKQPSIPDSSPLPRSSDKSSSQPRNNLHYATNASAYEADLQSFIEEIKKNISHSNNQDDNSNEESHNNDATKGKRNHVSYRTLLKITSLSRSKKANSGKRSRVYDILTTVSVCAMLVVVSITAIQYTKDRVRKVYYAKMLQNLGLGETVLTSPYGFDAVYQGGSSPFHVSSSKDLGSVLTSFTEFNTSRNGSLEMLMPYENVKNTRAPVAKFQLTSNPGFSNSSVSTVPITYTTASSFPSLNQLLPFLETNQDLDQACDSLRGDVPSRILVDQWGYTQTPTLVKSTGGVPLGTLYKTDDGSNVFYRDDRIFFKKHSP